MEMPNILANSEPNHSFQLSDDLKNREQSQDQDASSAETPQKRRPGRPKGSGKKAVVGEATTPKMKRPVGRPRKDGFPAGSVAAPRPRPVKQPRHSTGNAPWPVAISGVGYPQPGAYTVTTSMTQHVPIDPDLQSDDWAVLARTNPNAFLTALLAALAAPNPISTVGPTIEEAFRSHLGSLAPNASQTLPIPSLYYVLKTFWLPASPSYFSLTASASTARTPSEHRFLYWDPQPLVFNGIACPSCATPLVNRGRISTGPIKIYDIEKPFFVIGCEYTCLSSACVTPAAPEGRKFASTDSSVFRSLPQKLKDEFPARLLYGDTDAGPGLNIWNWKAMGVSRSLWNLVRGCLRAGMGKETILHLVHAVQHGVLEDEEPAATPAVMGQQDDGDEEEEDEIEEDDMDVRHDGHDGVPAGEKIGGPAGGTSAPQEMGHELLQKIFEVYADTNHSAGTIESARTQAGAGPSTPAVPPTHVQAQMPTHSPASGSTSAQVYDYAKPYGNFQYAAYAFFPPTAAPAPVEQQRAQSLKRGYPFSGESAVGEGEGEGTATKRSPRHCCKCGSQECKGKGGRAFCQNACQDCGKLDCKGRNSRRPDKKCDEGWVGA